MELAAAQNARVPAQADLIGRVAAVTGAQAAQFAAAILAVQFRGNRRRLLRRPAGRR